MLKQRFHVEMLPTYEPSYLVLQKGVGLYLSDLFEGGNSAWHNQHLYIVSYELNTFTILNKPEKGDWVYNYISKKVYQLTSPAVSYELKIVASTDKNITPKSWIPNSFVKDFIKIYNKIEIDNIHEIYLEMIQNKYPDLHNHERDILISKEGSVVVHPYKFLK